MRKIKQYPYSKVKKKTEQFKIRSDNANFIQTLIKSKVFRLSCLCFLNFAFIATEARAIQI